MVRVGRGPGRPPSGQIRVRDFLGETLRNARPLLPEELRDFHERFHGSLAKAYYDDASQHYELWFRRAAGRVELGLHFESRDAAANARMLDWFAEALGLIKAELGERTEAERWDRGWTRVHQTLSLPERLSPEFADELAQRLARFIELLEPLRRDAMGTIGDGP
jgi:hypothetical protein